jgi:hypothetical protein
MRTREARVVGGITTMFGEVLGALVAGGVGFVAIQLFVPVLILEPRAVVERGREVKLRGVVVKGETRGVVVAAETLGMRTMFAPDVLRPRAKVLLPALGVVRAVLRVMRLVARELGWVMRTPDEPREEDPREMPLDREGLMLPRELVLPRELMEPRELLPREGLMLPRELLPRELLWEAPEPREPLEPRCAWVGASRMRRIVARRRESWRIRRITVLFVAVRMADGHRRWGIFAARGFMVQTGCRSVSGLELGATRGESHASSFRTVPCDGSSSWDLSLGSKRLKSLCCRALQRKPATWTLGEAPPQIVVSSVVISPLGHSGRGARAVAQ